MDALDRVFRAAASHRFYRDALAGIRDFGAAPILEKSALYDRVEAALRDPNFRRGLYLSPSGGTTTGRPLYFPSAIRDNRRQRRLLAPRLRESGIIRPDSIVLNLFPCHSCARGLEIFTEFSTLCGATALPLGAQADPEDVLALADRFGATMVAGMPAVLLGLANGLSANGRSLALESALFAGEPLHPPKRAILEAVLGVRRFGGIYGSAEMGIVAYQADVADPPVYRFPTELLHVEVVDADADGFGRMVVTNLVRTRHPLLRFDSGDVGRVVGIDRDEVLLELRGRQSDSFSIGGNYSHLKDFEPIFRRFPSYQVVLDGDPDTARDRIAFRLAPEPLDPAERPRIEREIRSILGSDDEQFQTRVDFVRDEALQRAPGSLKIPAIVDRRAGPPGPGR